MKLHAQSVPVCAINDTDPRSTLLDRVAREAGRRWAEDYRQALRLDRRAVSGGWPGTLSEARAVAAACLSHSAARDCRANITAHERERVARLINASARRDWLDSAAREAPDPLEDEKE